MTIRQRLLAILLASLLIYSASSFAKIRITFWNAMSGNLKVTLDHIVQQFNQSQSRYHVVSIFKGTYSQLLTQTVAAFRAQQQPDIVQVYEVGTALMIHPKGITVPVYQLLKLIHAKLSSSDFIPAVAAYYANNHKQLLGFPFNSSSAILYYNKDAFNKAGLNPNQPPKTWPALAKDASALLKAGYTCGFTTTFPSWIQVETFSAWNNQPLATENNGFKGLNTKLLLDTPAMRKQFQKLKQWQKTGIFHYGGRASNAQSLFISGECPMMMQSSGSLTYLQKFVSFKLGAAMLPYWPSINGAPQNTIIGGAALWALSGHSKKIQRGIAEFFVFLAQPKIQLEWANATGYIPTTKQAFKENQQSGYYKKHPYAKVAIESLNYKPPRPYTRGLRLGNYPQIRDLIDEALEATLLGELTPKQALHHIEVAGNRLLRQFQNNIYTAPSQH